MIFIGEPKLATQNDYDQTISQMVELLAPLPGVRAIYQIGGTSAPGISDIDMVVIFDDGVSYDRDLSAVQTGVAGYLFTHQLFGTSRALFEESTRYTFFHNFRLLHGEDLRPEDTGLKPEQATLLKQQLAREYLVRMLISMTVNRKYNLCQVRSLLLLGNGLVYDLEFLGEKDTPLMARLDQLLAWRSSWFSERPDNSEIESFVDDLWHGLKEFLHNHLGTTPLLLPGQGPFKIGRHIKLERSDGVATSANGISLRHLPSNIPDHWVKKMVKVQNRLNRFVISVPFETSNLPKIIEESFDYSARAMAYNKQHLPHFMPLCSSLMMSL